MTSARDHGGMCVREHAAQHRAVWVLPRRDDQDDHAHTQQKSSRRKAKSGDAEHPLLVRFPASVGLGARLAGRGVAECLVNPVAGKRALDRPDTDPASSNHGESEAEAPHHAHLMASTRRSPSIASD
jgi:hypothetical protein